MRRAVATFLSVLACLALAGSARAQDEEPAYAPASEAHRGGRWSMQFEIGDNFRLQSFEGAGLAVTHNTSPSGAWRFGVNLQGNFIDGELTTSTATDSAIFDDTRPMPSTDNGVIALDVLRLVRYMPDRRVGLQLGFGPTVRFARQNTHLSGQAPPVEIDDRNSITTYGALGRLGVEVFVARAVSLHAHYGAFAGYEQSTRTLTTNTTETGGTVIQTAEAKQHRWAFLSEGVTMGISVYL